MEDRIPAEPRSSRKLLNKALTVLGYESSRQRQRAVKLHYAVLSTGDLLVVTGHNRFLRGVLPAKRGGGRMVGSGTGD
jgi:hypothetical protein